MLCGNLSQVDDGRPWSPRSSSRRRSRRKEKNPYANRGLDQFKMVLADLQARKEKIMAQVGASDPFLVWFAQSNLRDWEPIVIKLREPKQQKSDAIIGDNQPLQQSLVAVQKSPVGSSATKEVAPTHAAGVPDGRMKKRFSRGVKNNFTVMNMRRPSNYWPVVVILILLCLVMFGRSFAIMCTSICWYLVPTNRVGNVNLTRSMNKNYGRRLSEKNLVGDGRCLQSKMGHSKTFT
ncbi:hypothetical protein MRB53_017449 [Persea americana]|uniref:Uncharacterized protein n=1 Tax=Persea americana TaxID=3435 RepID=A0ACC2M560_PERAE|nr:hypothetical protein MRB53_017449 [Persea americana]